MIGLLSLYYAPLSNRLEDGKMGYGSISDEGEPIEVRFRPLASFTSNAGTEFSLLVLPLGGFARMRGMEPHADGSEIHVEGGFYSKRPIARLLVLFAGPLFSILLGCLLFFMSFAAYGEWKAVDKPTLARLSSDGAAAKAGLKEGDKLLKIAGKVPQTFYDIVPAIRDSKDNPISISYQRGAKTGTVTVTPVRASTGHSLQPPRRSNGCWRQCAGCSGSRLNNGICSGCAPSTTSGSSSAASSGGPHDCLAAVAKGATDRGRSSE